MFLMVSQPHLNNQLLQFKMTVLGLKNNNSPYWIM